MKTFNTQLAPKSAERLGGFGSGGGCNPRDYATELFKDEVPGAMLACYMFRRFGWPNVGSDPYKESWSWLLTTPMKGLYLYVEPYLGDDGTGYKAGEKYNSCNLHFAVRFTEEIQKGLMHDPGRESFWKRQDAFLKRWWKQTGSKIYTWGCGDIKDEADVLVHKYGGDDAAGKVWGLWQRTEKHTWKNRIPKRFTMIQWWLSDFLTKKHPEIKQPEFTKREKATRLHPTRIQVQVKRALQAAMADLLRPTNIRDISFTPFGDIERTPQGIKHYKEQPHAEYFKGAGMTPEYYYKHATAKQKRGEE